MRAYPPYPASEYSQLSYNPETSFANLPYCQPTPTTIYSSNVRAPPISGVLNTPTYYVTSQGYASARPVSMPAPSRAVSSRVLPMYGMEVTKPSTVQVQRHVGSATNLGAQVINQGSMMRTAGQMNVQGLQGYSRIEYVPYESYYIDYELREYVQNVVVPIQKKVTDYYAVEHIVDYVPKEIEETVVEMVPQERVADKLYYVPVEA
jgi:hypothetical protein